MEIQEKSTESSKNYYFYSISMKHKVSSKCSCAPGKHSSSDPQSSLWADLCAPEIYVQGLNPGTCECDLIWKQDICKQNQIKIKSCCIRLGDSPITAVLIKRGKFGHRHKQGEDAMWQQTQKLEGCIYRSINAKDFWQLLEARGQGKYRFLFSACKRNQPH